MITGKQKTGYFLLILTILASVGGMFFTKPITQDPAYHLFSDNLTLLGIPNFWNVVSNLPFLLVGLLGIFGLKLNSKMSAAYLLFFIGIALVSIGSGYYHIKPNNETLVWDRLPMTIAFMALFAVIISEFVSKKIGQTLFIPLLIIGLSSVLYWRYSPSGDLRFYVLVQFLPLLTIPIILLFFKSRYSYSAAYWWLLLAYVIAKLFEHFDPQIHQFLKVISGHSLKHIAAALGLYILFLSYKKRTLVR